MAGVALWSFGTLIAPPAAHMGIWALCATRVLVRWAIVARIALLLLPLPRASRRRSRRLSCGAAARARRHTACLSHADAPALSLLQVGLGEGFAPSAATSVLAWQVPSTERSRAVTTVWGGLDVGSAVGLLLSGPLIRMYGWPSVFYLFAVLGGIWCLLWPLVRPGVQVRAVWPRRRALLLGHRWELHGEQQQPKQPPTASAAGSNQQDQQPRQQGRSCWLLLRWPAAGRASSAPLTSDSRNYSPPPSRTRDRRTR